MLNNLLVFFYKPMDYNCLYLISTVVGQIPDQPNFQMVVTVWFRNGVVFEWHPTSGCFIRISYVYKSSIHVMDSLCEWTGPKSVLCYELDKCQYFNPEITVFSVWNTREIVTFICHLIIGPKLYLAMLRQIYTGRTYGRTYYTPPK